MSHAPAPGTDDSRSPAFRWQAFALHLALSLVACGALALLVRHWYPGYLFTIDGGWQTLRITLVAGLLIGPPLTLLVANPRKARHLLRLDFSLIALAQTLVLAGGAWVAWEQRPYAVIWVDGTFYSRPASAFHDAPAAREKIAQITDQRPAWITIDLPADPYARDAYIRKAMQQNSSVEFQPELYRKFSASSSPVVAAARKLAARRLPQHTVAALAATGIAPEQLNEGRYLLVPAKSRYGRCTLIINSDNTVMHTIFTSTTGGSNK